jgi:hypothetical protein
MADLCLNERFSATCSGDEIVTINYTTQSQNNVTEQFLELTDTGTDPSHSAYIDHYGLRCGEGYMISRLRFHLSSRAPLHVRNLGLT